MSVNVQIFSEMTLYLQSGVKYIWSWIEIVIPLASFYIPRCGFLSQKLYRPTVGWNCSSDQEKFWKFKAEGKELTKILRSLEQFIRSRFLYNLKVFGPVVQYVVYNRNHYSGLGPIPKPNPKLADTFGRYRNRYRNHISKQKSSYQWYGVFFQS